MLIFKPKKDVSISTNITKNTATVTFNESTKENVIELDYSLNFSTTGEEYVLFPACCYDGNRFEVLKKQYPPLFTPSESSINMPVTITDVPRLNKDGSGKIEVTTGDLSVPCVGVFSKEKNRQFYFIPFRKSTE